jgi:hypothetical protein
MLVRPHVEVKGSATANPPDGVEKLDWEQLETAGLSIPETDQIAGVVAALLTNKFCCIRL